MLEKLLENIYWWQGLNVELHQHLNGYVIVTRVGTILIDPPRAERNILEQLEALGRPRAVIVTGRPNERRAKQYQDWYGAKVFAPEADGRRLRVRADNYYKPGETLPGGFKPISLGNQRTPGESVLHHPQGRILLAPHLVGEPKGYLTMEAKHLYGSFSRAFEAQLKLLELDFKRVFPGRGAPVMKDGKVVLAKYLAGYTEG